MIRVLFVLAILAGCTTAPPAPAPLPAETPAATPAPPALPPEPADEIYAIPPGDWNNIEWTRMAIMGVADLGVDLLLSTPADVQEFCPAYPGFGASKRARFWALLLSAMARLESGFKPGTSYKEDFQDSTGAAVISRGLLQISKESANGYGCAISDAQQLHDVETNIRCAVRILNRWVPKDGRIAGVGKDHKGGARYWSVLRALKYDSKKKAWVKKTELPAIQAKVKSVCN